jgi:hypothetical protein
LGKASKSITQEYKVSAKIALASTPSTQKEYNASRFKKLSPEITVKLSKR